MQNDGNFVVYVLGEAIWSSGTAGYEGAYLEVQDDGNVVIYTKANRKPIWSTGTGRL